MYETLSKKNYKYFDSVIYKGWIYFLANSTFKVKNRLLGKTENGEYITEVLRVPYRLEKSKKIP